MTNEEAIRFLENISIFQQPDSNYRNALDIAIKALEQQPCCDCISRDEAKRIVDFYKGQIDGIFRVNESIDDLPRVKPKGDNK